MAVITSGQEKSTSSFDTTIVIKSALSAQWIGLAIHPQGGTYPELYFRKLDPGAYFVIELGLLLSYELRIKNKFYAKASTAYYSDCAGLPAGFFHCGIYWQILNKNKHILSAGLGPTLVFREDWHQLPGYVGDAFFDENVHGKWQYKLIPFGSIDYNYNLTDNLLLNISLIPAVHLVITTCVGLKFIIN